MKLELSKLSIDYAQLEHLRKVITDNVDETEREFKALRSVLPEDAATLEESFIEAKRASSIVRGKIIHVAARSSAEPEHGKSTAAAPSAACSSAHSEHGRSRNSGSSQRSNRSSARGQAAAMRQRLADAKTIWQIEAEYKEKEAQLKREELERQLELERELEKRKKEL